MYQIDATTILKHCYQSVLLVHLLHCPQLLTANDTKGMSTLDGKTLILTNVYHLIVYTILESKIEVQDKHRPEFYTHILH